MFVAILIYSPFLSFSQQETFFQSIDVRQNYLNSKQAEKFENIKRNKLHKSVQIVKLGNIKKIAKANKGVIPINFPGSKKKFVARPLEIEFESESNYIWKGEFLKNEGTITIICKKGEIFGHIALGDKIYEIHSFEKDKSILIEFDKKQLSQYTCGSKNSDISVEEHTEKSEKALKAITSANVRVLFLYTDAANNAVSSISNTVTLAINQMNTSLQNSNAFSDLRVNIAGVERLAFAERWNLIREDVEDLSNNTTAHNLRDTHQADLVILLTDGNYHDNYYTYYGIVDNIGPSNTEAYAIVEADQATAKYIFAHEAGHLFGGRHHNDPSGSFQHGYYFKTGWWPFRKDRTTIMYANPSDYILHYSNPDVEYKNKATGTSSTNDVARKLRAEALTVEAFRPFPPPLSVYISGPTKGNNSGTYTWYANVSNGTASSYLWKYSLDGYNYNGTLGTSSSITAPLPLDNDLYLKLTVTSSNGQSAVDYHFTMNLDAGFGGPKDPLLKSVSDNTNKTVTDVNVSYIPELKEDVNGRIIKSLKRAKQERGQYSITFNPESIKSGIYFCQLIIGDEKITQKIIVE